MKLYLTMLISMLFVSNMRSQQTAVANPVLDLKKSDTVQFILQRDFRGNCNSSCIVYVGNNNSVKTINGVAHTGSYNYSLFIACPTQYRFKKNKHYTFIAKEFYANACTQVVDSLANTKKYKLITMINQ